MNFEPTKLKSVQLSMKDIVKLNKIVDSKKKEVRRKHRFHNKADKDDHVMIDLELRATDAEYRHLVTIQERLNKM